MAVAVVAVTAVELVLLAKETLVELVETGAVAVVVAVPELLVVLLPDPMAVLGELESLIQSLEVLYTTPEVAEVVEMEEVMELEEHWAVSSLSCTKSRSQTRTGCNSIRVHLVDEHGLSGSSFPRSHQM